MTPSPISKLRDETARTRAQMAGPPDGLSSGLLALSAAVDGLSELERNWRVSPPTDPMERAHALGELEQLRRDVRLLASTARTQDDFWRAWARMLGLDTGYAPAAAIPIEPVAAPHVSVEG